MRERLTLGVVALIAIFLLIVSGIVLGVGTWKLGWFIKDKNLQQQIQYTKKQEGLINAQAHNNQDNSGAQNGYLDQLGNLMTAIQGAFTPGQAESDALQACEIGSHLTGSVTIPSYDVKWLKDNCNGSALSPSSTYYVK